MLIPECLGFMQMDSPLCKKCFFYGSDGDCAEMTEERKNLLKMNGRTTMDIPEHWTPVPSGKEE
jgi:hypothetical protein